MVTLGWLVALTLGMPLAASHSGGQSDQDAARADAAAKSRKVAECLAILESCPDWSHPPHEPLQVWRRRVTEAMAKMDRYETGVLRKAVVEYVRQKSVERAQKD